MPKDQVVVDLATQIRNIYCLCFREFTGKREYGKNDMPYWDGDPTGAVTGSRRKNIWPSIAQRVVQLQADPFQYVKAQFHFASDLSKPPQPNMLLGERAAGFYDAYRLQVRRNLEEKVSSDDNQIRVNMLPLELNLGWSHEAALDYALRSQACGASALLRYCHAVGANLAIATDLRAHALMQYMFQMAEYDAVLNGRIPEELKQEARRCYERLVST